MNHGDCLDCHRPMRGSRHKAAEHPGTVSYCSNGLCQGCTRRRRRTGQPMPENKQPRTHMNVTATTASLMAYLQWRKPFRAKAGQS